jgi:hypothetical protein
MSRRTQALVFASAAACGGFSLTGAPLAPHAAQVSSPATLRMAADAFTSKDELLLSEEIERSGVEADLEAEDKVLDTMLADSVAWSPSARGEPGKTPRDLAFGPLKDYCTDLSQVFRRKTRTVECGPVKFGSEHRMVRQTMATTLTSDVEGSIEQIIRCADEGFDLVRVTVVGMKDAKACLKIREGLDARGYDIPLCADMHFAPKVALAVADAVEKVRINPGNFVDGRKTFENLVYETDEEYFRERAFFVEALTPLVEKCKKLNRAMRIGTNHGSLSARVLSFYGDTPRGMVCRRARSTLRGRGSPTPRRTPRASRPAGKRKSPHHAHTTTTACLSPGLSSPPPTFSRPQPCPPHRLPAPTPPPPRSSQPSSLPTSVARSTSTTLSSR